jgi:hypothetical protein
VLDAAIRLESAGRIGGRQLKALQAIYVRALGADARQSALDEPGIHEIGQLLARQGRATPT